MADISVEQKPAGQLTWVWALAAIVAVIALMVWLASTRDLVTQTAVETETTEAADSLAAAEAAGLEATELSAIGNTPDQFVDQEVRVQNVAVAAVLGDRGFWAEIPGANPFLMVVGPAVSDVSWIAAGDTVSALEGAVHPVTEEAVAEWVEGEMIREGAAAEASFATHYLEVNTAEP